MAASEKNSRVNMLIKLNTDIKEVETFRYLGVDTHIIGIWKKQLNIGTIRERTLKGA